MSQFRTGDEVVVKIPEMRDKVTGEVFPAEEFRGRVTNPNARCMISRIPGMEVSMPDGGTAHIDPAWATPYVKPVRTPLTEENLLAWIDAKVKQFPTTTDLHGKNVTNSRNHLLGQILLSGDVQSYSDYGRTELLELVLDWCQDGVKGYSQMTEEELLKEVREQYLDDDNCGVELHDLEDLLEFANFDTDAGLAPNEEEAALATDPEIVDILSPADKAAILEDFIVWSGGHHPRECDIDEVRKYVEGGADAKYDENALEEFLEECRTSEEPRG